MRDHNKLRAFQLADEIALLVYQVTRGFPVEEMYGLTDQMRRAAVSIPSNIVEGCARSTEADFRRFLEIAFGSLRELHHQSGLSYRLGFLPPEDNQDCDALFDEAERVLAGLLRSLPTPAKRPSSRRPKLNR